MLFELWKIKQIQKKLKNKMDYHENNYKILLSPLNGLRLR